MHKVINRYNYKPSEGFKSTKPSMTIPGQAKSVEDWLKRLNQGYTLPVRQAVYSDDEVVPTGFDLTDIDKASEILRSLKTDGGSPSVQEKRSGKEDKKSTEQGEQESE